MSEELEKLAAVKPPRSHHGGRGKKKHLPQAEDAPAEPTEKRPVGEGGTLVSRGKAKHRSGQRW